MVVGEEAAGNVAAHRVQQAGEQRQSMPIVYHTKLTYIFFITLLAISLFTAYNSVHPNLKAVQARVGKELQFSHKNSKSFEVTYF